MSIPRLKKLLLLLLLALTSGVLMGGVSAAFLKFLELVTTLRENAPIALAFFPIVGIFTAYVYKNYGKDSQRGNNLIIDSVHKETHVPFRMALFSFIFTILTHLTGGSAGREGTAVQIGGTLSNKLGQYFKLNRNNKRILVMAGISAGFGSVFGTPLTGAFFGMEMCFIGKISYEALFPCFIASFTADYITRFLGISHAKYIIKTIPAISLHNVIIIIIAACIFGLVGRLFAISIHSLKRLYVKLIKHYVVRALLGSLIVLAAMFIFNAVKYDGLSTWMIEASFNGTVHIFDPILKLLLTVLTLGSGFQGGEVTPLFDIGASLGSVIGQAAHMEPSLLAALGLISVFGCAANTPITTIMLGIEMFGTQAMPYYTIAALISYYISGYNGIYPSQIIAISKGNIFKEHEGHTLAMIDNTSKLEDIVNKFKAL